MKKIPVHLLKERTGLGIQIKRFTNGLTPTEDERKPVVTGMTITFSFCSKKVQDHS